jgi:hypothetical protein
MELIGVLTFGEGQYWVCNQEEAWACLLEVGDRVEVLMGGEWQAVTMLSGGYHGRYFCGMDGQCMRPALCMRVRVAVC